MPSSASAELVVAWGFNTSGELGISATPTGSYNAIVTTPTLVTGMNSNVTSLETGRYHSISLRNGSVYTCGTNNEGQLGLSNAFTQRSSPVLVDSLASGVSSVAAGEKHSLAIRNGGLYAWGDNSALQCGKSSTAPIYTPTPVTSLSSGVTSAAGGSSHTLAIRNGAVFSFGSGPYGQLGTGTVGTNAINPVLISSLSANVTSVAAGFGQSMAIQNGALFTWGLNSEGQLGLGNHTNSGLPTVVSTLASGVTSISAGGNFSFAVRG